ncbi:MAG: helix-turn-helix transcriptional regulator [Acidobacteria bacterium]|nr:helix-turn-helix transcriptional regulator [Acidobacteriota bacterium]
MPRRPPKETGKRYYMISAVSQRYDLHPQTLRLYEKDGLLRPSRTEGNTRLYSDEDLERLEVILNLTRTLGVNLAGVEVILNMRDKMGRMQEEMNAFLNFLMEHIEQSGASKTEVKKAAALARLPPKSVRVLLDRLERSGGSEK